jgi:hypothetical protein
VEATNQRQEATEKVYEVNWLGCTFAMKRFGVRCESLREELGLSVDSNGGWIMMERMDMDRAGNHHVRSMTPSFGFFA